MAAPVNVLTVIPLIAPSVGRPQQPGRMVRDYYAEWMGGAASMSETSRDGKAAASACPTRTSSMASISMQRDGGLQPQAESVAAGLVAEEEVQTLGADMAKAEVVFS